MNMGKKLTFADLAERFGDVPVTVLASAKMPRLNSRNPRYVIRSDGESGALWYIADRTTGRVVAEYGVPLGFLDPADAEGWIALHGETGWGKAKDGQ